jgi:hypothetical protein
LLLRGRGCHFLAATGATSACLHALLHAANSRTAFGACLAYLGASRTRGAVEARVGEHEICSGAADFRAARHEPEVVRFDVLAACLQAVIHGIAPAGLVAVQTFGYAVLHFLT